MPDPTEPNRTLPAPLDQPPSVAGGAEETALRGAAEPKHGAPTMGATGPFGGFVVVGKLGEGGMGAVYLAEDPKLRRRVAIKTMRPELAADPLNRGRFEREARAAAAVEHDHIVPILHVGEAADGTPYIVMPYLKGEPLDVRLRREPVSPSWLLLQVAREVADGLAAAHAVGLVHRDVKPANVWLEGDPDPATPQYRVRRCKVLDFGLARAAGEGDAHLTGSGAVVGTPAYMAPEQARGEVVDGRADLWGLGALLYRMAAGRNPFRGESAVAVLIALATETPPAAAALRPDLPPALCALIDRLLQKDPGARPQTAAEVAAAARAIEGGELSLLSSPAVVGPTPPPNLWEEATATEEAESEPDSRPPAAPPGPLRGRLRWLAGGACAGLLALAVLAVVLVQSEPAEATLVVEVSPDAEPQFLSARVVLVGADGSERYALAAGERQKKVGRGAYTVRVEGGDGLAADARAVTIKGGDRVTVRVSLASKPTRPLEPPKKDGPDSDADRRAAEYALAVGGTVRVNGGEADVRTRDGLPNGDYALTGVNLTSCPRATDAGLTVFGGCTRLTSVNLNNNNHLSDAGVRHFVGCKGLTQLQLWGVRATDAGLAAFGGCARLEWLNLGYTGVTDAGLAHFRGCAGVSRVWLFGTAVTDAGMAHLDGFAGLTYLCLCQTRVGDAGLARFKGHAGLTQLHLEGSRVTDDGLADFVGHEHLSVLVVRKTRISRGFVEEFARGRPGCRITWDGGVIEPKK